MKLIMRLQPLFTLLLFVLLAVVPVVCPADAAVQQDKAAVKAQATIQTVEVVGDEASVELLITTSTPVTYTSYKSVAPARLVMDFAQTVPADGLPVEVVGKGAVKAVAVKRYDTDAGILTRMEIHLAQDVDPVVNPVAGKLNQLRVTFPGFKPAPVVAAATEVTTAPVASVAQGVAAVGDDVVVTGVTGAGNTIQIEVKGSVSDYKTFRLAKPERVVVDLLGAKANPDLKIVPVNAAGISTARVGSYSDKTRVVLDAIDGGLPDAVIAKNAAGVTLVFSKNPQSEPLKQPVAASVRPVISEQAASAQPTTVTNQIEAIDFQAFEKLSRVTVKVKGAFTVENPTKVEGFVSFRIHNTLLPKQLQRSYEAREFASPVLRVTPIQVRTSKGEDTIIRVAMRADAAYSLRKEADIVYLEFVHAPSATKNDITVATANKSAQQDSNLTLDPSIEQQITLPKTSSTKKVYFGRKITLEFADAEVRKIFQLLSEVSNKNFVLGDDVKGEISLKLVNVPWDQALDIILDTKELDKREEGNIILVRGKGKFKSLLDEEVELRKATLKSEPLETAVYDVNYADLKGIVSQFNALKTDRGLITSDERTNKIIVKDVKSALDDMRNLLTSLDIPERQVMIEARIIEASTDFVHSLGINWLSSNDPPGSGKSAPFIADHLTSFGGLTATGAGLGVPGLNTDILFGTIGKNVQLQMRINAAASAGLVRIISTPKVATLNHKSAKITQGQQIPYTSATADKIETKFVEAALSLEVTPHINANGTIVMKIDAKNDAPGSTGNPPPINKKQATTEMLLSDGETTVIGGIYVDSETEGEQGVPWLKDVPLLGNLFKSTDIKKTRTELLIFVTPRLLNRTI